jgi:type IV secretory pathway ATPase VirB11/archaellum biosynthesis ATPase
VFELRSLLGTEEVDQPCDCTVTRDDGALVVDGTACDGGAALASQPCCRSSVIGALETSAAAEIRCIDAGVERTYLDSGPALFGAAAAFASAVATREPRLARRVRRDPLAAAREAVGRAGPVARIAADVELDRFADASDYGDLLAPVRGPAISSWRRAPVPPSNARLVDHRSVSTGATVRRYECPDRTTALYHLEPAEARFDATAMAALADAYDYLADAPVGDGDVGPGDAVHAVTDPDAPRPAITRALRKHVHECGLLADLFADPALSDVYVTAPASHNAVRVRVDGETLDTNVTLTSDGVAALASRFRRESGRGFSRARPVLDAATTVGDRRVRVAGVTDPVSEGDAFAFRAHDRDAWTLPALVENDTVSAEAAGLLSVCVERGGATLLAGPRGSGKTTTLGALLWEIPASVRTVLIEDAPELPVETLQDDGRDVQALRAESDGPLEPVEALRSALRLGDGALVVGEVRGEEAGVLYEAMRVGANSEAVLGTIHGDGGTDVLERVVSDLGVPASSFATTDLIVTQEIAGAGAGQTRRVRAIEEIIGSDPVAFEPLFDRRDGGLSATGRIERGNSRLVADLTRPAESYRDVLEAIEGRAAWLADLATTGRTDHETLGAAQARRQQ